MVVGVGVGVAAMGYGVRVGGVDGVSKTFAWMRHFAQQPTGFLGSLV